MSPLKTPNTALDRAALKSASSDRRVLYDLKLVERPMDGEAEAVGDDRLAMELLAPMLWPSGQQSCPRCSCPTLYELSGKRLRCKDCRYTFTEFTGRFINSGNMDAADWLYLARLFVEGQTVHQAAAAMDMSYNTTYKALTAVRFAIAASAPDAPQVFGPDTGLSQFVKKGRLKNPPRKQRLEAAPVFGIIEQQGLAFADVMPGIQAETVLHYHLNFHLPIARNGNIVHTGPYRRYQTLVTCMAPGLPFPAGRGAAKPEIDRDPCNFWKYAKRMLSLFKGVTPGRFPLYLKELEFRYNHRDQDLLPLVLERLCRPVPDY